MANPSFNLNYTVLSACDATTGWSQGALDTDGINKEGNQSLVTAIRNDATVTFTPTAAQDMSATDTHLRLWFQYSFPNTLDLKSNGGVSLFVTDNNNNTNFYYCEGSDTYEGGWVLLQADLSSPDVNGGANLANITACGYDVINATAARNLDNTWWDWFAFGTGYEIYGGTSGDKVTWDTLATTDASNGYGVVQKINGVYFVNGRITFGDTVSTNDLYFDSDGELVVFYDANEKSGLYKLVGGGNSTGTTSLSFSNTVIKSAATAFTFDMSGTNVSSCSFVASTLDNSTGSLFKTGQTITGSTFANSAQVDTGGATMTTSTFTGSTDAGGAWLYSANATNCNYNDNTYGVEVDQTGTLSFNGLKFSGNTSADINNTSGGAVIIQASNGADPSTSTGSTTIQNTVVLTITPLVSGSEVRIYTTGTTTELDGVENSGTSFQFSYNYSPNTNVDIVVHNVDYNYFRQNNFLLPSTSQDFIVNQVFDRNYSNP